MGKMENSPQTTDLKVAGTLASIFQAQGTPFKLDIGKLEDVRDIPDDPSVLKALETSKPTTILTDDDIEDILPKDRNDAYKGAIEQSLQTLMATDGNSEAASEMASKSIALMSQMNKEFMASLKSFDPALHSAFEQRIENFVNERGAEMYPVLGKDKQDVAQTLIAFQMINDFVADGTYSQINLPPHIKETHMNIAGKITNTYKEEHPASSVMRIPSPSSDGYQKVVADAKILHTGLENIAPPPGTPQQQNALIAVHEIEHAAGDAQAQAKTYFENVKKAMTEGGYNTQSLDVALSTDHAEEVESGLAQVHGLKGVVPDDLLKYDAALRIAADNRNNLIKTSADPYPSGKNATVGFAMLEYMETGNMPDYYEHTTSVNGFYAKTNQMFAEQVSTAKAAASMPASQTIGFAPTVPVTMDMVRQTLAKVPPVYTPAEEQVAQTFLRSMQDDLKLQPQSVSQTIAEDIAYTKSLNAPTSTPKDPALQ